MIRATEILTGREPLFDLLSPEVLEHLDRSREILDSAARLRASVWRFEDALREWETRAKAERPRGRRWRTLLSECSATVAEAIQVHHAVYEREREARPHLLVALDRIRRFPSNGEQTLPDHALRALEDSSELRRRSLEALERLLRLSQNLARARPKATIEEILDLLEERRRQLGLASSLKADADVRERRAFLAGSEAMPPLSEAAERAVEPEDDRAAAAPRPGEPRPVALSDEGLRDEEWEAWLDSVGASVGEPPDELDAESGGGEDAEWAEAVLRATRAAHQGSGNGSAASRGEDGTPSRKEKDGSRRHESDRTAACPTLSSRMQELTEGLRAVQQDAERERDEATAGLSSEIERLKAKHSREMTLEIEARRETEHELEKQSELAEDLASIRREQERLEEEVRALEATKNEVEATFRKQEAEAVRAHEEALGLLELERAADREKAAEEVALVEGERDRALALVSALTRRLEMAGISGGDPEDERTLTEELKQIREAVSGAEDEVRSLRSLCAALREEVAERLDGAAPSPVKRDTELVDA